jgi:Ca2+-binding EF-hand superfamily protein
MRTPTMMSLLVVVGLASAVTGAVADDKADYDRRNAERYTSLFAWLDRDGDGAVTRTESFGDVNFTPVFDDMDIDRDGAVTTAELRRYVDERFGRR